MRLRKRRLVFLYAVLIVACVAFSVTGFFAYEGMIPSTLYVRTDEEETFDFHIPATGEILAVGTSGKSNIPEDKITIDLSKTVLMKTGESKDYSMQVKLFGVIPLKQVDVRVIEEKQLIPLGKPVGIYLKTNGIMVIGVGDFEDENGLVRSPALNVLKSGDYIVKANNTEVSTKDELMNCIQECESGIRLEILRGGELQEKTIPVYMGSDGQKRIGIWVRDNVQGIGTMTFMDSKGNFGALGHGITDADTGEVMESSQGSLYSTEIVKIKKGKDGDPGEMTGVIVYGEDRLLGHVNENSNRGIYGELNEKGKSMAVEKPLEIALRQEVVKGPALILTTIDGKTDYYEIEITGINLVHDRVNRGIEFLVTDEELIEKTGGIIQGMSGSPIIQNDKIIGAVTHVMIQNSKKGYGIFIDNMLGE